MEDRIIPALDSHAHEKLGPPTMNVGTIAGGSKVNIVPDACRIDVDFRVVPGYQAEKFRAWVEAEIHSAVPDAHVAWGLYWPPLDTSESLPWVKRLGETARGFTTAPWFSDASALGGPDCPAVCIGPGSIAQAHTKDEFILVRDLEEGAAFFRRWIDAAEASVA
jgi:acetylornithine deacetylase/succinyl-diaminopimelate desuccinylase-like protein